MKIDIQDQFEEFMLWLSDNFPRQNLMGIKLEGGKRFVVFSEN